MIFANIKKEMDMLPFEVIFLDLDGVLCDFIGSVVREFPELPQNWRDTLTEYNFHHTLPLEIRETFWQECAKRQVFLKADPLPYFNDVKELCEHYSESVVVLTSAGYSPEFYAQKREWLNKYWGSYNVVMTMEKVLLAKKRRLLIDDSDKNCMMFMRAGGDAIVFPQIWNQKRFAANKDTILIELRQEIDSIICERYWRERE